MYGQNNPKNNKAFTLVELIVVIVILAILTTIAFLSFSSQSGSARDSTRLSDISSIKKSVEMYNVNAWTYPTPDYAYSYTYSGWVIWNQWTIWDSAYKLLQKNLSKKVVDPLKWSEYDYSLASNKREYQVAWNFENPTSLERNYNPFDSSNLNPKLSALWWTGANVYISWNYNWVMLKVFTWSTYYFVPTPTLFWIWTWSTVYDNTFWSWKDLLPWVNNVAVFDSSKVYATWSDNLWSADITNLMTTVKAAYSTWNVTTPAVQAIVSASWAELVNLWAGLVKNSLGWAASSTSSSSDSLPTCSAWMNWNGLSCVATWTVLLLHLDDNLVNHWTNPWMISNNNWASFSTWKFWNSLSFNWTNQYLSIPDSNDWYLDWDFTIDFWAKLNWGSWFWAIGQWDWYSSFAYIFWNAAPWTTLFWMSSSWGWWDYSSNYITSWTADWAWSHYAVTRSWSMIYMYADWINTYSGSTSVRPFNSSDVLKIGLYQNPSNSDYRWFNWLIDEIRLVKWKAMWTNNFTPPAVPY